MKKNVLNFLRAKNLTFRFRFIPILIFCHGLMFSAGNVQAQAITEGFETGAWVTAPTSYAVVAGNGGNWTKGTNSVLSSAATGSNNHAGARGLSFSSSSSSFLITPVISGGVAQVTLWVYANGTSSQIAVGVATNTSVTNTGSFSSTAAGNMFSNSSTYATAGGSLSNGAWRQITFTANITAPAFIKIQRLSNNFQIDDIEVTSPAVAPPATQASNINFAGIGPTTMDVSWTRGDGGNVAVFMKEGAGAITNPTDGTTYTASANWNNKGTQLGASGYYCVYNGPAATVNVSNLLPSTNYTVQAFEYNGTGASSFFNVNTATNNPNSQTTAAASPTITATPSTVAFGGVKVGATAEMNYSLSAVFLNPTIGNITVTAPTGYLVSTTSGSGYGSSIIVPYTASTLAATTIYVQFAPTAYSSYPGVISNTGGSAPSEDVTLSGTGVEYNVGDLGSVADGNWSTPTTWKKWDGVGFNTAGTVPSATDNVYITNNKVVTLTGTGNFKNLTVESGQLKGDNATYPTGTTRALTPSDGGFITVTGGVLGSTNVDNTETNIALTANGDFTLNGTGGIVRVSRIRCSNSNGDMDIHINRDITLVYTGSGGAGGMAINSVASSGNSPTGTKSFYVGAGATLNLLNFGYIGAETSASGDSKLNTNFIINGVLNANDTNNIMNLRTQVGYANSLTIGSTGVVNISGLALNGAASTITLVNNGVLNLGSAHGGTIDFTNTAGDMFITGTGSTVLKDSATLLVGSPDGITTASATGPIRTTARTYESGANYSYVGTAAQVTGNGLTSAYDVTFNNASGVTLSQSLTANGSLRITKGALLSGANNLTLGANASGTIDPGATLDINNALSTVDFAGRQVTIRSTAAGTGRIGTIVGTLSNATNVSVERYIPANGRRAWRLLGANLSSVGAPSISATWQESGAALTSTGTFITQAGGAGTNGFDASSVAGASSIRYWDGTALQTPANTDFTKITDNGGAYFLFVRGNRTIDLNNTSASSNTTLRMKGTVNQGALAGVGVAGATSLIPNPYPSPVDYEAMYGSNPFSTYYVWDANLSTTGAYRTIERTGANTYQSTPSTGSPATDNEMRYIRSGQAIFVNGNTTFSFTEAMKTDMTPSTNVFRTGAGIEQMTIDLKVVGATTYLADGVRAKYSNSYSNMVNTDDIVKFNNFSENLGILRDGQTLAVEKRDLVDAADTIFLKLWNTGIKDYQFDINPTDFSPAANLDAVLVDNYLSTNTPVSLSGNTTYNFSVSSVAASAASDRFMIVFRPSAPLPVNFTQVKAYQKEAGIQVEWNVASEVDVVRYEVEKSMNGTSFDKAGTITASNSKSYSCFDATPNIGANFYRIKVVNKDNSYQYSSVVNVKLDGIKGDIAVYPNPVKGSVINVQFNNLEKGTYTVQLINILGQQVYSTRIVHNGGSASQALQLNNSLIKGVYHLQIGNGSQKIVLDVIAD